ncbi:MAG: PilZ domain-containing protein [Labilithrix sp.]|nr:PilZ domain-containing protein [Labilithrix sp.]MCW5810660.1 PilZ domain-containing protein [Labilithrix sp.]
MSNAHDRRAPGTSRIPFDAMVELAGALGPSFEAQAVNLSEEGMSFRTAYLPDVGQPVMCRFDTGHGMTVTAAGEVVWKEDMGEGGEFGIRFTNLDGASTVALQRILGMAEDGEGQMPPNEPGRKVRLHIEGLASPMRARIKDQMKGGVTAYTELGFLRMDRPLELEDAASGNRRPALIEKVEVAMDGSSKVPQLVVGLRYDDEEGRHASMSSLAAMEVPIDATPHDDAPAMEHSADGGHEALEEHDHVVEGDEGEPAQARAAATEEEEDDAPNKLKAAMAKVTPAIVSWATRAKTAAALLAAKARRGQSTGEDVEIPVRRTTAPAPGGGLHAEGRKVVRGGLGSIHEERFEDGDDAKPKPKLDKKKKAVIAGTIGLAGVLVFFAMKKPASPTPLASAPPAETAEVAAAPPAPEPPPAAVAVTPPLDPLTAAAAAPRTGKPGKPTPFTNGPVGSRPNIIKIKMDGPIEAIQGATQPSGFTIVTPNRKSIDPAAALADKDPRLAGLNVSNEESGAELTVTFKDGVPNYVVRAKGDTLELVFAGPSGRSERSQARETPKKKTPRTKKR